MTEPRNVRNFWLDLDVDGRNPIATGPRSSLGGFCPRIFMREAGKSVYMGNLVGTEANGILELEWSNEEGAVILAQLRR